MPLGDSITWDWHYSDYRTDAERSGYRNYLWYLLQNEEYDVDFVGSRNNGEQLPHHLMVIMMAIQDTQVLKSQIWFMVY